MGVLADLTVEWERHKAAREALALDATKPETVRALIERHRGALLEADKELNEYLTEGVLTEAFVVDNIAPILDTLRKANTSLRWALLHRRSEGRRQREAVAAPAAFASSAILLDIMLRTAMLELRIKAHVRRLLAGKAAKWAADKAAVEAMLLELAEYFSGARALTRVRLVRLTQHVKVGGPAAPLLDHEHLHAQAGEVSTEAHLRQHDLGALDVALAEAGARARPRARTC